MFLFTCFRLASRVDANVSQTAAFGEIRRRRFLNKGAALVTFRAAMKKYLRRLTHRRKGLYNKQFEDVVHRGKDATTARVAVAVADGLRGVDHVA